MESTQTHSHCQNNEKPDWLLRVSLTAIVIFYGLHWQGLSLIEPIVWLNTLCHSVFELVNTVWWGVLIGIVMLALLSRIPQEFVTSALGAGNGLRGIWRATFAGVLLDLCSHGILMVGAKLYQRGLSAGQLMAFLLASPWNSLSLTIILVALIGLQWTIVFILLSMLVAVATGVVFDRLVARGTLPANPAQQDVPANFRFWPEAKNRWQNLNLTPEMLWDMLREGIKDSRMVVRWLLFGVLLASALRVLLAPEQFGTLFGPTLLGLGLTMLAATVLEVCSEGATPVAADILTRGGAPGNSFAFLMGGVATDYTEIVVLHETTASWKMALFLPLITLPQIIVLALVLNLAG